MIAWKSHHPWYKNLLFTYRQMITQLRYFDNYWLVRPGKWALPKLIRVKGYQSKIAALYNKHKGQRCFIVANGPGLAKIDMSLLKNEITIGCNGIYKNFDKWGFALNYLVFEDIEQFEIRAKDLKHVKGPVKMAAIFNAYALDSRKDFLFFNVPRNMVMNYPSYYWSDLYPQFSKDFASVVHLGSTITYIMLQLAYFLGFKEVYIVGLDHNYGMLPKLFPPGKIKITSENYEMVQQCHVDKNYYKIGDVIGVPWVALQEKAYAKAKEVFEADGRKIINLSVDSKLDVFEKGNFNDVI